MTLFPGNTTDSTTVQGQLDEMNLRAFTHPDFPGERLVAAGKLVGKALLSARPAADKLLV